MTHTMDGEYVVCPHCGYQQGDCWEWVKENEAEDDCPECGKRFAYWAEYSVTYHAIGIAARSDGTPQSGPAEGKSPAIAQAIARKDPS